MTLTLPNHREFVSPDYSQPQVTYGVVIRIVPGDSTYGVEIARAPDSSGSPGTWVTIDQAGPFPRSGGVYVDPRPSDGAYWWYRGRHIGPGGAPTGTWLTFVARVQARRLDELNLTAQLLAGNSFAKSKDELELGDDVRGAATVVFGGTVKFGTNRHNESLTGINTDAKTFSTSYEQVPELRVIPQTYLAPTAGNSVEFKALDPTISGFTIRAVQISSLTVTARSDDFHVNQNTTPGTAAGVALGAPGSLAYCQLSNANGTATTYRVYFDVNTTSKSGGGLTRVTAYKNASATGTVWTQVGQNIYDDGMNVSGEHIDFSAALGVNYDVKLVVSYSGTPTVNASVTADRVDYDEVTGGTATSLTGVASAAVLVQAVEKS